MGDQSPLELTLFGVEDYFNIHLSEIFGWGPTVDRVRVGSNPKIPQ